MSVAVDVASRLGLVFGWGARVARSMRATRASGCYTGGMVTRVEVDCRVCWKPFLAVPRIDAALICSTACRARDYRRRKKAADAAAAETADKAEQDRAASSVARWDARLTRPVDA